jgi:hypothetical protein
MSFRDTMVDFAAGTADWDEVIAAIRQLKPVKFVEPWDDSPDTEGTYYEVTEMAWELQLPIDIHTMLIDEVKRVIREKASDPS